MTQLTSALVSIIMFLACGRADQGADSQPPSSLDASATVTDSELPNQASSDSHVEPVGPIGSVAQDPPGEEETVTPPIQVTGTYMHARILVESATNVEIGLSAYHNGERVSMHPDTLQAIWSVTQPPDVQVSVSIQPFASEDTDVKLLMSGESLKAIRAQYKVVNLLLQVKDLKLNKDTPQLSRSISAALEETTAKETVP